MFSMFSLGEIALQQFPSIQQRILQVWKESSFEVEDLRWIAECMGGTIRLSMGSDTYKAIVDTQGSENIKMDAVYGAGKPLAHLYFRYTPAVHEKRAFGHFDVLVECATPLVTAKWFQSYVSWQQPHPANGSCVYLCVYMKYLK